MVVVRILLLSCPMKTLKKEKPIKVKKKTIFRFKWIVKPTCWWRHGMTCDWHFTRTKTERFARVVILSVDTGALTSRLNLSPRLHQGVALVSNRFPFTASLGDYQGNWVRYKQLKSFHKNIICMFYLLSPRGQQCLVVFPSFDVYSEIIGRELNRKWNY